ncbi:DUF899 domain-containing protein [Parasphingorhabdus sp.]|uniref:DUF899 domain-containing protein n=1 Tax=Parasphingorhabdus sp. TaxID=2709688 RepID=UPI003263C949
MAESAQPEIVTQEEWQAAIDEIRVKEKELTRTTDAINAMRRQLPMVKIEKNYTFDSDKGTVSLLDLFDGRKQLIVYHFMFAPEADAGCPGCSWVTDAMSHPAHLNARDTSLVLVSRAPLEKLDRYKKRMGWTLPWVSSFGSDFNHDFNATNAEGENHVASVFLRDGDDIYRTYYTDNRGVEHLGSHWTWLDLTPYGRQEPWEVTPDGWPKGEMFWDKRHDEYEA